MRANIIGTVEKWWDRASGSVTAPARGARLAVIAFFVVTAVCLGAITAVNYAINPLYMYNGGGQLIRTGERIFFRTYTRIAKPHIITDRNVSGIAFGSSRTEYAIDPTHRLFGPHGYNGGLSGGSIFDMREMVYHTSAVAHPQTIVMMLNTYDGMNLFDSRRDDAQQVKDYTVLAASSDGKGSLFGHYTDRASLLMSWFQASLAIKNLGMRNRAYIPGVRYHLNGQRYHQAGRKPEEISAALKSFGDRVERAPRAKPPLGPDPEALRALKDTVTRALTKLPDVRLIVITEPIHSSKYASTEFNGMYDRVTGTMIAASRIVEKASNGKAEFWDCSLFNAMTEEVVPAPSTARMMTWWNDSSHPNAAFGNKILDQLAERNETVGPCAPVNSRTEADYLARRTAEKSAGIASGVAMFPQYLAKKKP